jgi:tetratricopeptide (TPR) repeat protein
MVERILTEHGPLHEDDIEQRLRGSGVADPDSLLEAVLDELDCPARQLVDDQWVWLPTLLAGRVLTHRLSADELAHDVLTVTPDLEPITALCEHEQFRRLADGSEVQIVLAEFDEELLDERDIPLEVVDPPGALLLEPGTLEQLGVAQGDLVGLRLTERGLVVERVTAVPQNPAVGEWLAATLDAEEPVYFDAATWTVCVEDPAAFTEPQAPLCEIADDYGLACRGEWLAPGGFDYDLWEFERGCERLAARHDLDADDAFVLYTLVNVYDQMSTLLIAAADADESLEDALSAAGEAADEPPEEIVTAADEGAEAPEADAFADLVGELGGALADPLLAELLLTETVGTGDEGAAALGVFADMLEPKVPRAARVACRWLRAVALERMGDIDEAERELLAAESMDPDWPLPLFDLARFASDRGDVERGLALLRRAGAAPDHLLVKLLEQHRPEPRRDLGRNELCWCGSGRKYKKCHLGHEQLPLAERVGWLYAKAVQHALVSGWNDVLTEVGLERCRYADVDDLDALTSALTDPLVLDAVLFEGGAFEEFLGVRGSLLPDDERQLVEQWLLVERSVFEVEQVRRGQGVTVRDVRTGDTHEVRERAASRQLKPGQLLCARVVPAGDTMQFVGVWEPVALHERDPLIDLLDVGPDPVELVAQLSRRFAPPTLTNTEGDPLAICEATMRVGAPDAVMAALDDTYDRVDGQEPQWLEHVNRHGMPQIRAVLVLDGDMLRVETNSERRMDRVLATVRRLDPTMTVLTNSRRPVRDISEVAELAKQMPLDDGDTLDPDDPEVAAALEEFILEYETKWLDEPIPALDGHTPRQAADDPTRRGDLVKLLDTFPTGDAARGGMDADRLRVALGLR